MHFWHCRGIFGLLQVVPDRGEDITPQIAGEPDGRFINSLLVHEFVAKDLAVEVAEALNVHVQGVVGHPVNGAVEEPLLQALIA